MNWLVVVAYGQQTENPSSFYFFQLKNYQKTRIKLARNSYVKCMQFKKHIGRLQEKLTPDLFFYFSFPS